MDTEGRADDAAHWSARVRRLTDELAGLRRAMRARALIEQAKGLLAGTLDCSPEAAFEHLSQLSQHENRRLVEVAARIMGTAVPAGLDDPPPVQSAAHRWEPARYLAESSAGISPESGAEPPAAARVLFGAVMPAIASAADPAELADRVLAEGLRGLSAAAVLIFLTEPDGALRLAGSAGLPASVASDWRRVPSPVPVPAAEAVRTDRPVWLPGRRTERYLLVGPGPVRACLPLRRAGRSFGCLEIAWPAPRELTAGERRYLVALAGAVSRRLAQFGDPAGMPGTGEHWVAAVLDAVAAPVLLLSPVHDEAGRVTDFLIDFATAPAGEPYRQDGSALAGALLLDVRPHLVPAGVFDAYRRVLSTGTPWRSGPRLEVVSRGDPHGTVVVSHTAIRLGGGLVVSWRSHDDEVRLDRSTIVEEVTGCGWAAWRSDTGAVSWSPGMYRLLGCSPARGPLPLVEVPGRVVPADRPRLAEQVRGWLARPVPAQTMVRLRDHRAGGHAPPRTVQVRVRPTLADSGRLAEVLVIAQDVTDLVAGGRAAAIRRVHRPGDSGAG